MKLKIHQINKDVHKIPLISLFRQNPRNTYGDSLQPRYSCTDIYSHKCLALSTHYQITCIKQSFTLNRCVTVESKVAMINVDISQKRRADAYLMGRQICCLFLWVQCILEPDGGHLWAKPKTMKHVNHVSLSCTWLLSVLFIRSKSWWHSKGFHSHCSLSFRAIKYRLSKKHALLIQNDGTTIYWGLSCLI